CIGFRITASESKLAWHQCRTILRRLTSVTIIWFRHFLGEGANVVVLLQTPTKPTRTWHEASGAPSRQEPVDLGPHLGGILVVGSVDLPSRAGLLLSLRGAPVNHG